MRKYLMPYIAAFISHQRTRQFKYRVHNLISLVKNSKRSADVYLRITDPYSYLLVQVLDELKEKYSINLKFFAVLNLQDDMYPDLMKWNDNAFLDAQRLAKAYDLKFPLHPVDVNESIVRDYTYALVKQEGSDSLISVKRLFDDFWSGHVHEGLDVKLHDTDNSNKLLEQKLLQNEQKLLANKHYLAAMLYYEGEWFWGLDRLLHLEQRLSPRNTDFSNFIFNKHYAVKKIQLDSVVPGWTQNSIKLYLSIRSPYSHLALEQAIALSEKYKVSLELKPVLPMVMRGLKVPTNKKMYIFFDTKREAERLGIDYGFVADPVGQGVERGYALFEYAQSINKGTEFLLSFFRAVNAKGIHADTNAGLKQIVLKSGLDWDLAKEFLSKVDWKARVATNVEELYEHQLWGVPCIKYNDTIVWGQDRMWVVENLIADELARVEILAKPC